MDENRHSGIAPDGGFLVAAVILDGICNEENSCWRITGSYSRYATPADHTARIEGGVQLFEDVMPISIGGDFRMRIFKAFNPCKAVLLFILPILLISCGGGGGDGGQAETDSDIALSKDAVNLNMEILGTVPTDEITVYSTNSKVAKYGFEFTQDNPDWLDVHTGSYNDILVNAAANDLPVGHYESMMTVFVKDASDNIIATKDIKITLAVVDQFEITSIPESLYFSGLANTTLPNQVITFTSNTGTYPDIWSTMNDINKWMTATDSENLDSVTVTITPQPIGTYEDNLPLLYYFNGSPRWLYIPITYRSN